MQKIYERINWENDPSTKTALNEDNLNKMDYALDQIDNRVVALSGYEERAKQSETNARQYATNAKVSENNAKVSESNAKQSEVKSKEYMENAFKATPEGYQALTEQVDRLDIQTTTDSTLHNSKEGGARLVHMDGNSEQRKLTGKNLLVYPYGDTTKTQGGITWTDNGNGSISANGTSTSATNFVVGYYDLSAGDYIFSKGVADSNVYVQINKASVTDNSFIGRYYIGVGEEVPFTVAESDVGTYRAQVLLRIESGVTVSNLKFYPMIRKASVTDGTYEPYVGGIASPNPSYPQVIKNTGDCVEMEQGTLSSGAITSSSTRVRTNDFIPCKNGDILSLVVENDADLLTFVFYDENKTYINNSSHFSGTNATATVSNDECKYFKFIIGKSEGVTPETVGKITLTINDKYVVPMKTHGKNELDCSGLKTTTTNGLTFTPVYKSNGELDYINVNGTATARTDFQLLAKLEIGNFGGCIFNGCPSGGSSATYNVVIGYYDENGSWKDERYDIGNGIVIGSKYPKINIVICVRNGVTVSNLKFYPMLRKADITDDTWEPYTEHTEYILLDEPLRKIGDVADRIVEVDDVWGVERRVGSDVFDGSGDEQWKLSTTNTNCFFKNTDLNYLLTQSAELLCDAYVYRGAYDVIASFDNAATDDYAIGLRYEQVPTIYMKNKDCITIEDLNSCLNTNPIKIIYQLATPTFTPLDTESQKALNRLKTFNSVTYVEVDSVVQPSGMEFEYGTSQVGAYTLRALNENNIDKIERAELKAQLLALSNVEATE